MREINFGPSVTFRLIRVSLKVLTRGSCFLVPRAPSFLVTWSLQITPGGSGDENGVRGVGTRDEPLRTSAWEAMRVVEARGATQ